MNHFASRPLVLTLAATLLLAGCGHSTENAAAPGSGASVPAEVITINETNLAQTATFPAGVVASEQIQIASRIMGYVRQINVETGQHVKAGQLLITVDPTDIQGQVSLAQASLAQAEAALADAKADYDRFGDLYREEAIPKAQWDKIRLQYAVAQQQANAARAGHATAEAQMRYAAIHAPFAGVITQRMTSVGALAAPGQPLLMLVNPASLDIETQVPEAVYARLKVGETVGLHVNSAHLNGTIRALVPSVDPVSHTHLVKIALPAAGQLQSGMFATVDFRIGEHPGLRLPASAVIDRAGIPGVFVVDAQGIAQFRMVRPGDTVDGQTTILAGLENGEHVVLTPPTGLQTGDHVVRPGAGNV